MQVQVLDASEEASLQDQLGVKTILHALEIIGGVFYRHELALLVLEVVLVNNVQQGASYA